MLKKDWQWWDRRFRLPLLVAKPFFGIRLK